MPNPGNPCGPHAPPWRSLNEQLAEIAAAKPAPQPQRFPTLAEQTGHHPAGRPGVRNPSVTTR